MLKRILIALLACIFFVGCQNANSSRKPQLSDEQWDVTFELVEAEMLVLSRHFERISIQFSGDNNSIVIMFITDYPKESLLKAKEDEEGIAVFSDFAESVLRLINAYARSFDQEIAESKESEDYFGGVFDYYGASVIFAAGDFSAESMHFIALDGSHSLELFQYEE